LKIAHVALALTALSLPMSASALAPDRKPPSEAALQLAKMIAAPYLLPWLSRTTADEMKARVKAQLLSTQLASRGAPCDPNNAACRAAAEAIASKHAAEYARAVNDAVDEGQAMVFDAKMSPAQIRATLAFVKTDAGKAFTGMRMNGASDRALLTSIFETLKVPSPPFEEFYDATKAWPRAVIFAPPVIPPPRPPSRDR
jgi:hypothetical protein